jgi:Protein of unknown function (DUF3455)
MKSRRSTESQSTRRRLPVAGAAALAMAFAVSLPLPARAEDRVTPPPVPANIQVPAGNRAFLKGHAFGTQNYICLPSGAGFKFVLFTPQATLFQRSGKQVITHFFSPNPFEGDAIRATWQHSRDSSIVWGPAIQASSDPAFVAPGAIAWLLVQATGVQEGPGGGDTLTATTFVQRLNTSGGLAPSTGCGSSADVGKQAFVPYEADYFFHLDAASDTDENDRY